MPGGPAHMWACDGLMIYFPLNGKMVQLFIYLLPGEHFQGRILLPVRPWVNLVMVTAWLYEHAYCTHRDILLFNLSSDKCKHKCLFVYVCLFKSALSTFPQQQPLVALVVTTVLDFY